MREDLINLAYDFWWTGDPWAHDVWNDLDPFLWERLHHNPIALLQEADIENASTEWKEKATALLERYQQYLCEPVKLKSPNIAYFCMEFGLHESFQIYSGGLGILAGDHIRSAGDLKLNFVGVGLFYKNGYFTQSIVSGSQVASWPNYSKQPLPVRLLTSDDDKPVIITVPFKNGILHAQVWTLKIGFSTLYLLDTDLPENTEEQKSLTASLYGGDQRRRIAQEMLLGIGGVRVLEAINKKPDVYHLNEGHAAFLLLELWIRAMHDGLSPKKAWESMEEKCVFTTHTPVPAGHDQFYWDLVNEYLGPYRDEQGIAKGAFMNSGRIDTQDLSSPLSMTVLGLRGSRKANGVSKLHGEVSREMFPVLGKDITHITNGVHPTSWLAPEMADLFNEYLPGWQKEWTNQDFWTQVDNIPYNELWETRKKLRSKLITEARRILRFPVLNENHLTIGFARRFATYKRGALIFSDTDRLEAILQQGTQLIFAGKAHPADIPGQKVLATVTKFSRDSRFRGQVVFIPDYNMHIGRLMTQGCDVWLNNPRRPREASGTSGQKVSLNGGLNLSSLDGWWPEAFDGGNGWGIGDNEDWINLKAQDQSDVNSLYSTLEEDVLPAFADPKIWTTKMKHAITTCAPVYNTHRMVLDYLQKMYLATSEEVELGAK
jgi:glycogen phosphorylase